MPVTTRSKSRLLSAAQAMETKISVKPSKTIKQSSKTTKSASPKQPHKPEEMRSSIQETQKESYPPRDYNEPEQLLIVEKSPSPSPPPGGEIMKTSWPCRRCPCHKGAFRDLINSCTNCGHDIDDHDLPGNDPWYHGCTYISERQELVDATLQHARKYGVVVIRATPQVGKSVLLQLLGHRIANYESDLEPVYIEWENREKRKNLPYKEYLTQEENFWQRWNARVRPRNPAARPIYLIDEAQGSYEEEGLWSSLKNHHNMRAQPLFVLVCVYGAAGISYVRDPKVESQARRMHALHRIELRPSTPGNPCMLFGQDEVGLLVKKFAIINNKQLQDGLIEYLHHATSGHPGMVGLLLVYLDNIPKSVSLVCII